MKRILLITLVTLGLAQSSRAAANLVWNPTDSNWDILTTANWRNIDTSATVTFGQGDNVLVDDVSNNGIYSVALGANLLSPTAVVVDSYGTYSFATASTGKLTNVFSLTKKGSGTLILDADCVITNAISIEAGTLQIGNGAGRGTLGSGYPGYTAPVSISGTLAFNRTGTLNFSNSISGSGTLSIPAAATGTWNLYGNNTMSGYSIVHNGGMVLYFRTPGSLGTPASVQADAALNINVRIQMGGGLSFPASCPITSTLAYNGGSNTRFQLMSMAGVNSIGGPIALAGDSDGVNRAIFGFYAQNAGTELNVYSSVSESDPTGNPFRGICWLRGTGANGRMYGTINLPGTQLVKTDASTWTLYASGNKASETAVSGGRLTMGAVNVLPVATLTVTAELDLAGFDQTTGPLWGAGSIINSSTTTDALLTLTNGGAFTGSILDSGTAKIGIKLLNPGAPITQQLTGNCSYRGQTTLDIATAIALGNSGLPNSTPIEMGNGSTIDLSTKPGNTFTLGLGQTLKADGEAHINGNFGNSGTLSLRVRKIGGIVTSDSIKIESGYTVTYGGALYLELSGDPLGGYDEIKLFTADSYSGSFSSIVPPTPGPGRTWNTSTLATDGKLRITSTLPTTPTTMTATVVAAGTELQLGWPVGYTGWGLQAQTNAPGVGITTAWHYVPGSDQVNTVTIPIDPANGSVFFRMFLP
jgi:fibronectin-binding autotransporter adhesin